jgi:hypothetical protein
LASPNRPRRRSPIRSRVQPPVRLQSPPRSLGGLQLSPRTRARRYYHINRDRILQNRLEKRESIAQRNRQVVPCPQCLAPITRINMPRHIREHCHVARQ